MKILGFNGSFEMINGNRFDVNSLGNFYLTITRFLGFDSFDEYKVMGLAPYGDPNVFRSLFETFYSLKASGKFEIHWEN